jgi:hypothetical protein
VPEQHVQEAFCNLGYADPCAWAPRERAWDAVRFGVVSSPNAGLSDAAERTTRTVYLRYVCERNHLPVEHGSLEFDLSQRTWLQGHGDPRVQRMAECFLDSYVDSHLKKRV